MVGSTLLLYLGIRNFDFSYSNPPSKEDNREYQKTVSIELNTYETKYRIQIINPVICHAEERSISTSCSQFI